VSGVSYQSPITRHPSPVTCHLTQGRYTIPAYRRLLANTGARLRIRAIPAKKSNEPIAFPGTRESSDRISAPYRATGFQKPG